MLIPWEQPVARIPPAHPQFLSLVIGHKPVVRLLLLRSADVARYCLPDHRISSVCIALSHRADPHLPLDPEAPNNLEEPRALDEPRTLELPQAFELPQVAQTNPIEYFEGRLPLFHRVSGEISEI
jgi:hypothetical protein